MRPLHRLVALVGALALVAAACGDSDDSPADSATPAPPDASVTSTSQPAEGSCPTYTTYRDHISDAAQATEDLDIETYVADSLELIDQMEASADEQSAIAIAEYRFGVNRIGNLYSANDWQLIADVDGQLVPLVDEVGFDAAERHVWEWAAAVCGPTATSCRGFLDPLVEVVIASDLGYLVDPESCEGQGRS